MTSTEGVAEVPHQLQVVAGVGCLRTRARCPRNASAGCGAVRGDVTQNLKAGQDADYPAMAAGTELMAVQ